MNNNYNRSKYRNNRDNKIKKIDDKHNKNNKRYILVGLICLLLLIVIFVFVFNLLVTSKPFKTRYNSEIIHEAKKLKIIKKSDSINGDVTNKIDYDSITPDGIGMLCLQMHDNDGKIETVDLKVMSNGYASTDHSTEYNKLYIGKKVFKEINQGDEISLITEKRTTSDKLGFKINFKTFNKCLTNKTLENEYVKNAIKIVNKPVIKHTYYLKIIKHYDADTNTMTLK